MVGCTQALAVVVAGELVESEDVLVPVEVEERSTDIEPEYEHVEHHKGGQDCAGPAGEGATRQGGVHDEADDGQCGGEQPARVDDELDNGEEVVLLGVGAHAVVEGHDCDDGACGEDQQDERNDAQQHRDDEGDRPELPVLDTDLDGDHGLCVCV